MAAIERMSAGLRTWSAAGLGLEAALTAVDHAFGLEGAVSMLYAPAQFAFARVEGGRMRGPGLPLDGVFEARVFTPDVELRWLAGPDGGRAAVLHERPGPALDGTWTAGFVGELAAPPMPATYLLWGRLQADRDGLADGWCWLAEARIGRMAVPHPGVSERLVLAAREYVAIDGEHGNAYVVAERLLRIEPAAAKEGT